MDYSEQVKASEAADMAYSRWYYRLPKEKKAAMYLAAWDFVKDKIRYDLKKENPYATEAEVKLRFIEINYLDDMSSPKAVEIIYKTMERQIEEEWKARIREMKQAMNWTYAEMATYMGAASAESLRATLSRKVPAFAKLAYCVYRASMEGK